jgi:hypothetical protein
MTKRIFWLEAYRFSSAARNRAKSSAVRLEVTSVKYLPRCGSTAQKTLQVPFALVFVVHPLAVAGNKARGRSDIFEQLNRFLIQAQEGKVRVKRAGIELKELFHAGNELCIQFGHAPALLAPRF